MYVCLGYGPLHPHKAGGSSIKEELLVSTLYQTAVQFDILNLVDVAVGITVSDRNEVHISYERM